MFNWLCSHVNCTYFWLSFYCFAVAGVCAIYLLIDNFMYARRVKKSIENYLERERKNDDGK